MNGNARRSQFVIKDMVVSLPPVTARGGGGGTFLPADDDTDIPWWLSPVVSVLVKGQILDVVNRTITDAIRDGADLTDIARAFDGDPDGNPAINGVIHEVGRAVVAGAAYAAVGGAVGYPDPNCAGTSLENIPPTLTPIVHMGSEVLQVSHLPRLRKQLTLAVESLDRAAASLEPRGDEIGEVSKHLEGFRG